MFMSLFYWGDKKFEFEDVQIEDFTPYLLGKENNSSKPRSKHIFLSLYHWGKKKVYLFFVTFELFRPLTIERWETLEI